MLERRLNSQGSLLLLSYLSGEKIGEELLKTQDRKRNCGDKGRDL